MGTYFDISQQMPNIDNANKQYALSEVLQSRLQRLHGMLYDLENQAIDPSVSKESLGMQIVQLRRELSETMNEIYADRSGVEGVPRMDAFGPTTMPLNDPDYQGAREEYQGKYIAKSEVRRIMASAPWLNKKDD